MSAYYDLKNYFDEQNFYYEEKELEDGQKFFSIKESIPNSETLEIIFAFDEDETHLQILVYNIATISSINKREELYQLLNKVNGEIKFWKFSTNDEGRVLAEYTTMVDSNADYNKLMFPLRMLVYLMTEKNFQKPFMRLLWS